LFLWPSAYVLLKLKSSVTKKIINLDEIKKLPFRLQNKIKKDLKNISKKKNLRV